MSDCEEESSSCESVFEGRTSNAAGEEEASSGGGGSVFPQAVSTRKNDPAQNSLKGIKFAILFFIKIPHAALAAQIDMKNAAFRVFPV